eukprot:1190557-Prorocentrum_minimum.AAC.3
MRWLYKVLTVNSKVSESRVVGMSHAPLPLLAQEDPQNQSSHITRRGAITLFARFVRRRSRRSAAHPSAHPDALRAVIASTGADRVDRRTGRTLVTGGGQQWMGLRTSAGRKVRIACAGRGEYCSISGTTLPLSSCTTINQQSINNQLTID